MKQFRHQLILTLVSSAAADQSPWVEDFDSMLASVGCTYGPKDCGAENFFYEEGEFCGPGRGCLRMEFSGWEMCADVAQWQCFV